MSRDYRKEYDNYHSRPEQKIRRAARNAARARFKDADPNKDVHHKDNNPLNNDKNNLSLVTQHYNRREPRLRKEALTTEWTISDVEIAMKKKYGKVDKAAIKKLKKVQHMGNVDRNALVKVGHGKLHVESDEIDEAPLIINFAVADEMIADKFKKMLMKADFKKKQKLAKEVGITISQRGKKVRIEDVKEASDVDEKQMRMRAAFAIKVIANNRKSGLQKKTLYKSANELRTSTRAFQLHFDKVQDTETQGLIVKGLKQEMGKKEIYFFWDAKFAKRLASFSEAKQKPYASSTKGQWSVLDADGKTVKSFGKNKDAAMSYLKRNFKKLSENESLEEASKAARDMANDLLKGMSPEKIAKKYNVDVKLVRKAILLYDKLRYEEAKSHTSAELPPKGLSHPDAKKLTIMMQHYFQTKNPRLKLALLKDINKIQLKMGLKKTEEMGTVTGTHIAGTGDDSSTVVVKKKKKKKVQIRFKLKNNKLLRKRILDNVLAIQQKI